MCHGFYAFEASISSYYGRGVSSSQDGPVHSAYSQHISIQSDLKLEVMYTRPDDHEAETAWLLYRFVTSVQFLYHHLKHGAVRDKRGLE